MKLSFLFEDGVIEPRLAGQHVLRTWPVSAPLGLGLITAPCYRAQLFTFESHYFVILCVSVFFPAYVCMYHIQVCCPERALHSLFLT